MENNYFNLLNDLYRCKQSKQIIKNITHFLKRHQLNKSLGSVLVNKLAWLEKIGNEYKYVYRKPRLSDALFLEQELKDYLKNLRQIAKSLKMIDNTEPNELNVNELPIQESIILRDESIKHILDEITHLTLTCDQLEHELKNKNEVLNNKERLYNSLKYEYEKTLKINKSLEGINKILAEQNDNLAIDNVDLTTNYTDGIRSNAYLKSLLENKQQELENTQQIIDNYKKLLEQEQQKCYELNQIISISFINKLKIKFKKFFY